METLNEESAYVDAFDFHELTDGGQAGKEHQRRLVGKVCPYIVLGSIVPITIEKLETSCPIVIPSIGYIGFTEVRIVQKVHIVASTCIETAP